MLFTLVTLLGFSLYHFYRLMRDQGNETTLALRLLLANLLVMTVAVFYAFDEPIQTVGLATLIMIGLLVAFHQLMERVVRRKK